MVPTYVSLKASGIYFVVVMTQIVQRTPRHFVLVTEHRRKIFKSTVMSLIPTACNNRGWRPFANSSTQMYLIIFVFLPDVM